MVIIRVVDGTSAGVEVRFAGAWVGDTVGSAGAPVGEIPGVAGVDAGVDAPFVAVNAGVGPGVGIPGACVGTGGAGVAVASGVDELAGNGVVAAPGPGVGLEGWTPWDTKFCPRTRGGRLGRA